MTLCTYNAAQTAKILFVHVNRVLELASSGELEGIKVGRAWVFRDQEISAYLDRKFRERKMGKPRGQEW